MTISFRAKHWEDDGFFVCVCDLCDVTICKQLIQANILFTEILGGHQKMHHRRFLSISTHEFHLSLLCAPLWIWAPTSVGPRKIWFYSHGLRCYISVVQSFDNVFIGFKLRGILNRKIMGWAQYSLWGIHLIKLGFCCFSISPKDD